jgi:hypothetical protein
MFACTPDDRGYAEITITEWKDGPLLQIRAFDSDGERTFPSIDKRLAQTIFQAGYAPSSFNKLQAVEDEDTVWGWYLYPIEEIRDDSSHVFDTQYAIQKESGSFVRNSSGHLVTFDNRDDAEAVSVPEEDVVEVNN